MLPLTRWIGPLFCYCCIFQEKLCVHLKDQYNSVNHSSEAGSILVKSKIAEVVQQLEDNLLSLQRFITQAKTKKKIDLSHGLPPCRGRELVCLRDPANSAGRGLASGRCNQAGKINGERPDKGQQKKTLRQLLYLLFKKIQLY